MLTSRRIQEEALKIHGDKFKRKAPNTWVLQTSSINEVLKMLDEAKRTYDSRRENRNKHVKNFVSCWKTTSETVMQYEKAIETLVSSNPQYTALVWGSIKFLFMVRFYRKGNGCMSSQDSHMEP